MISASGRGVLKREPERSSLEALELILAHELEARAEQLAMLLDRPPIARLRRIVDHHDAFEIRPIELGDAVQRLAQHLRRLAIGRDVDRHEGAPVRHDMAWRQQALRTGAENDLGKLVEALLHDGDERHEENGADDHGDERAEDEIVRRPIVEDARAPGADGVCRAGKHAGLERRDAGAGKNRDAEEKSDGERGNGLQHPIRGLDRSGKLEFRLPLGIEHAPIGADAAFKGLPRLVERLDDRIVDAHGVGPGDEVADDLGLSQRIRHGVKTIETRARPAKLRDDDALAGIGLAEPLIDLHRVVDRDRARQSLPVRENVHGEVVDCGGKLGMLEPDIPDLGGGHRH